MITKFRGRVQEAVSQIPSGEVLAYGDVAALAGKPRAARAVGRIAQQGDNNLPWHRVVRADGTLAPGFAWGGAAEQQAMLESEGIIFIARQQLDLNRYRSGNV